MDLTAPFATLFAFFTAIFKWSLDGVLWLLGKWFYWWFDGLLTVVSSIFKSIDLSSFVATYAMNWAGLPPQMIWFINAVSIPQGLTILSAAIVIRMLINLIPAAFTRI